MPLCWPALVCRGALVRRCALVRRHLDASYTPELAQQTTGVAADLIRRTARDMAALAERLLRDFPESRVLLGDTDGNGAVTSSDIGQTKAQSGQPMSAANFRGDVNANGAITSSDIGQVKAQSGTQLP